MNFPFLHQNTKNPVFRQHHFYVSREIEEEKQKFFLGLLPN